MALLWTAMQTERAPCFRPTSTHNTAVVILTEGAHLHNSVVMTEELSQKSTQKIPVGYTFAKLLV
jgi:hypothetical protein